MTGAAVQDVGAQLSERPPRPPAPPVLVKLPPSPWQLLSPKTKRLEIQPQER